MDTAILGPNPEPLSRGGGRATEQSGRGDRCEQCHIIRDEEHIMTEPSNDETDEGGVGGESGSRDEGERGPGGGAADRPAGTSDAEDSSGVDPKGSGPESPEMPPA